MLLFIIIQFYLKSNMPVIKAKSIGGYCLILIKQFKHDLIEAVLMNDIANMTAGDHLYHTAAGTLGFEDGAAQKT